VPENCWLDSRTTAIHGAVSYPGLKEVLIIGRYNSFISMSCPRTMMSEPKGAPVSVRIARWRLACACDLEMTLAQIVFQP